MSSKTFKKLCDEHGILVKCKICLGGGSCAYCWNGTLYPTLSDLLDMVEEKWPGHDWSLDFIEGDYELTVSYDDDAGCGCHHDTYIAAIASGDTKEMAVLQALIGDGNDS